MTTEAQKKAPNKAQQKLAIRRKEFEQMIGNMKNPQGFKKPGSLNRRKG